MPTGPITAEIVASSLHFRHRRRSLPVPADPGQGDDLRFVWLLALSELFYGSHNSVFWSIPPALFPREVVGGARGIIIGMGNLGGFVSPTMVGWFITTFDSSDRGIYGMVITWLLACVFVYWLPRSLSKIAPKHVIDPAH